MYELYGALINLGALSRCPIRFSWASVCLCSSGSHKFEIYVHLSFGFRSFFSHLPIFGFGQENLPQSKVLSSLVN